MLNLIKKIINKNQDGLNKTTEPNNVLRTHLAAGVILLEAAHADGECSNEELGHIVDALQTTFKLSRAHTDELLALAQHEKDNALDIWQFTNSINQDFSRPEKIAMLEAMWRVILADGHLEKHEDHYAHKMANLLRLTHEDLINTKIAARKQLKGAAN